MNSFPYFQFFFGSAPAELSYGPRRPAITYGGDIIHRLAQHMVGPAVNENRLRLQKFHIGILLTAGVSTEADLVGLGPTRRHARDLLQDLRCPECASLLYSALGPFTDCLHEWLCAVTLINCLHEWLCVETCIHDCS